MRFITLKNILILIFLTASFCVVSYAGDSAQTDQDIFNNQLESAENAEAEAKDKYNWMTATFDTISSFLSYCIEVPQFPGITQSSVSIDLEKNPKWISTGIQVEKDKMLQINWSGTGIQPQPKKYKVMYRIDPRFSVPQVFIQQYSYDEDRYLSDFHQFKDGLLIKYQDTHEMDFANRIIDFDDYFNFRGRSKIYVNKQDVVNITLDYKQNFFTNAQMSNELGSLSELSLIYTESPIPDNRIIYSNATNFCLYGITSSTSEYGRNCLEEGLYKDSSDNWNAFQGRILNPAFNTNKTSLNSCADSSSGKNNDPLCYYDKGRGMNIGISGNTIKSMTEKFKYSPFSDREFFYYRADLSGYLEFTTFWDIEGMYNGYDQFMIDWPSDGDYFAFENAINAVSSDISMNHLYFGRYLMEIEIGNSESIITKEDLGNIEVEYIVSENGAPDDSESGTVIDSYYRGNAPEAGYLFFKVRRLDDNLNGSINIRFANYIGTSFVSDLLYTYIVEPLRVRFNEFTKLIYTSLAQNDDLVNALRLMLIIYISVYALMFLAGAVEIKVSDIVGRVIKIGVVIILFSETSWDFFNTYVFRVFSEGLDFLMSSVAGVTSNVGNPFGFIDPIFDKYTNPTIFGLLFIQLLQIHTGLVLFAIIAIYALFIYLKAILQVIIAYCVAFVGLSVMISLAPIFISFILFERTRSIFDNWLSVMFNYVIEPTILLIFFLLIDQIISDQILRTVARSCWGTLIPLNIFLDLNNVGIPLDFSFGIPSLPGIPFYIPEIASVSTIEDLFSKNGTIIQIATSSFLLFALSKLAGGMVHYVQLLAQQLTNVYVEPEPGQRSYGSMAQSIMGDIKGIKSRIIGNPGKWGKNFIKSKFSDQKISSRRVNAATQDTYGNATYKNTTNSNNTETNSQNSNLQNNRSLQRPKSSGNINEYDDYSTNKSGKSHGSLKRSKSSSALDMLRGLKLGENEQLLEQSKKKEEENYKGKKDLKQHTYDNRDSKTNQNESKINRPRSVSDLQGDSNKNVFSLGPDFSNAKNQHYSSQPGFKSSDITGNNAKISDLQGRDIRSPISSVDSLSGDVNMKSRFSKLSSIEQKSGSLPQDLKQNKDKSDLKKNTSQTTQDFGVGNKINKSNSESSNEIKFKFATKQQKMNKSTSEGSGTISTVMGMQKKTTKPINEVFSGTNKDLKGDNQSDSNFNIPKKSNKSVFNDSKEKIKKESTNIDHNKISNANINQSSPYQAASVTSKPIGETKKEQGKDKPAINNQKNLQKDPNKFFKSKPITTENQPSISREKTETSEALSSLGKKTKETANKSSDFSDISNKNIGSKNVLESSRIKEDKNLNVDQSDAKKKEIDKVSLESGHKKKSATSKKVTRTKLKDKLEDGGK
ncbi:MAG TPA: type IV secretion system protein [Candidatus Megaira endosymbiont of Nemacystus decipiens]|nr:type IV secretion system protein [Candidatus Megaera endosymbiont of Nemacystus decipiens]